ncbi:MAG TPA: hypothetical protein PKK31_11875, partial [Elusimicrobiales bacterium]|nr:hypothetical protein [Elusimicrobiales bacterium]
MSLRDIENSLREAAASAFHIPRGQTDSLAASVPPAHVEADLSLAWPISAARTLRKAPLKIAEEL